MLTTSFAKMFKTTAILIFLSVCSTGFSRVFENPVLQNSTLKNVRVTVHNGIYYAVVGTSNSVGTFPVYQSTDLQNWKFAKNLFTAKTRPTWCYSYPYFNSGHVVALEDGSFRLYFSCAYRSYNRFAIGVAYSFNILGPYSATPEPILSDSYSSLDNPFILVENGYLDMLYDINSTQINYVQLTSDGLKLNSLNFNLISVRPTLFWEQGKVSFPTLVKKYGLNFLLYKAASEYPSQRIGVTSTTSLVYQSKKMPYPLDTLNENYIPHIGATIVKDVNNVSDVLIYNYFGSDGGALMVVPLSWEGEWPVVSESAVCSCTKELKVSRAAWKAKYTEEENPEE